MPDAMDYLIAGYAFVVGSIVGSFLNVVVARVPEGRSIVHPPSSCPACGHRIRLRDNVPILGWLMLKGHCRDCGVRIPFRYPAVELLTAMVFLALVILEVLADGGNLPASLHRDPARLIRFGPKPYANPALWCVYLFHVGFFCVLLCTALMEVDGKTPPRSLLASTILIGTVVSAIRPEVHPISFAARENLLMSAVPIVGLLDALVGGAVGAGIGWSLARIGDLLRNVHLGRHVLRTSTVTVEVSILEHALVGIVFGWQTTVVISFFAACGRLAGAGREWFGKPAAPRTIGGSLWLSSLGVTVFWAAAATFFGWPELSLALLAGLVLLAWTAHALYLVANERTPIE